MKRLISFLCVFAMLIQPISGFASGGEETERQIAYSEKIANPEIVLPVDESTILKNGAAVIEVEDLEYNPGNMAIVDDDAASGGKALRVTVGWADTHEQVPVNDWLLKYTNQSKGTHYFWIRYKTNNDGGYSAFYSSFMNDGTWTPQTLDDSHQTGYVPPNEYTWERYYKYNIASAGVELQMPFKHRQNNVSFDKIIITTDENFTPVGKDPNPFPEVAEGEEFVVNRDLIPVSPKKGEHPRLYMTPKTVPQIKKRITEQPLDKRIYEERIKPLATRTLTALPPGGVDTEFKGKDIILSRAFMYAMGDLTDEAMIQDAINVFLETVYNIDWTGVSLEQITRRGGALMQVGSCLYDWCYDVWTPEQRQKFVEYCYIQSGQSEVGYPPTKRGYVSSHGMEEGIYNDQVTASIAIYDESPEMYDVVTSIVFGELLPMARLYADAGYQSSRGAYLEARMRGLTMADFMYRTLGYDGSILGENGVSVYHSKLFYSTPDGYYFTEDDNYNQGNYDTKLTTHGWLFRYWGNNYDDPVQYREGLINDYLANFSTDPRRLIITDYGMDFEEISDTTLTHFLDFPVSAMTARTSWQMGYNSPAAAAYINMAEVNHGDHLHRDTGGFQIYYKGQLALDRGEYSYNNGQHMRSFHQGTIGHNAVLIQNNDVNWLRDATMYFINDGGQKWTTGYKTVDDVYNKEGVRYANLKAKYAGPNEITPAFSYISSDISPAYNYTDQGRLKVEIGGYERSFVFMDMFNEDYPAAMVVYDNIDAVDANYKKTWLLQSQLEPSINKNTGVITIDDTQFDNNGRLVNKILTPAITNTNIEVIGGPEHAWDIDGVSYPPTSKANTPQAYIGNYRVEVSPVSPNKSDKFLNVMYVTDVDKNLPVPPIYKEFGTNYTGATIFDRMVTFSLTHDNINQRFNLNVRNNGYEKVKCLITDIEAGKWTVTGNGQSFNVESKDGEFVLEFEVAPGLYQISPTESGAEVTSFDTGRIPKDHDDFGDFRIIRNRNIMYQPKPGKLFDGKPYVAIDGIFTQLGGVSLVEKSADGRSVTLQNDAHTLTLIADSSEALYDGKPMALKYTPKMHYGELYAPLDDFANFLGVKDIKYDELVRILQYTAVSRRPLEGVDMTKVLTPVDIIGSPHDGPNEVSWLADRDLTSYYCTVGDGNFVQYDFGEVVEIDQIAMACYSGDRRKQFFDVLVSDDGVNYTTVLDYHNNSGKTEALQFFKVKASGRYLKVVFHGTTQGANHYNSILELIALKK